MSVPYGFLNVENGHFRSKLAAERLYHVGIRVHAAWRSREKRPLVAVHHFLGGGGRRSEGMVFIVADRKPSGSVRPENQTVMPCRTDGLGYVQDGFHLILGAGINVRELVDGIYLHIALLVSGNVDKQRKGILHLLGGQVKVVAVQHNVAV